MHHSAFYDDNQPRSESTPLDPRITGRYALELGSFISSSRDFIEMDMDDDSFLMNSSVF